MQCTQTEIPITILWLLFSLLLRMCDEATQLVSVLKSYSLRRRPNSNNSDDVDDDKSSWRSSSSSSGRLIMICLSYLLILQMLCSSYCSHNLLLAKCSLKTVSALLSIIAFYTNFPHNKVLLCVNCCLFECFKCTTLNILTSFRCICVYVCVHSALSSSSTSSMCRLLSLRFALVCLILHESTTTRLRIYNERKTLSDLFIHIWFQWFNTNQ